MKGRKNGTMRMGIELPTDIYYGIQKGAVEAFTTMTNYIIRALIEKFEREGMELSDSDRKFFEEVSERRRHKKADRVDKSDKKRKLKS
jgi:hypothetical protein